MKAGSLSSERRLDIYRGDEVLREFTKPLVLTLVTKLSTAESNCEAQPLFRNLHEPRFSTSDADHEASA